MHVWLPLIRTATGSEVYTRLLAERLAARGHKTTLHEVPHAWQYAPWLAPIRPSGDADVVLANSWNAAAFARRGLPLVSVCHLVVHDAVLAPFKSLAQKVFHAGFVLPMERAAVRRATVSIAVSATVAAQMRDHLGAREVEVVLNGVDTDFFAPDDAALRDRGPDEPFRLLFVGKPSLRKGFDMVAEIAGRLGDAARLTCVGALPARTLPRPVGTYTGHIDRPGLLAAYHGADLLLFPSRLEGFGYVAAEAMACGVPVAACRGTAVDEIVPPGGGIIREAGDISGFVDGIRSLIRDPAGRRKMRKTVRAHAVAKLSESIWIENTERALRAAIAAGG